MTSPLASRGPSAWISNAGALRAPLVRVARRARFAGVEDRDAHVDRRRRDARLDAVDRQARLSQAQGAVLGVARVIEEQRRAARRAASPRPPASRRRRSRSSSCDALRADQQRRVFRAHATEAGEDVVDLARVGARVEERTRVAAARVVAGDDREPAQPLRARGRRRRRHGEQREQARCRLRRIFAFSVLASGLANARTNCSPGRSRLGMRARLPPALS